MATLTLTDSEKREYERWRNRGRSALVALAIARAKTKREELTRDWEWSQDMERATFSRDGFDIEIRVRPDDYGDLSYMGSLEAIRRSAYDDHEPTRPRDDAVRVSVDRSGDAWYLTEHRRSERVAELSKYRGMARGPAYETATADIEREARDYVETRSYYIVISASRNGIELGSSSLGGIDVSDYGTDAEDYIVDSIMDGDMIGEAIEDARHNLAALRESA